MSMSLETGLAALATAAEARRSDTRMVDRLGEVQALLVDELLRVEATLSEVASEGTAPATDAARHLVTLGGKRVRPLSLLTAASCFGGITAPARELAVAAELVHSATLLHDDVVDDGMVRRGVPAARRIWGNGMSVLAGDLLLVHALERTQRAAPEMLPSLVATLRRLVDGEVTQLKGRTSLDITEATYERILSDKTASLFAWCTRSGARIAGATDEEQEILAQFGERLGVSFQLVDDLLDYTGEDTGKNLLSDLSEGKLTLPLVLAVRDCPALEEPVRRIHAGDPAPVAEVSQHVIRSGSCEEVRRRARRCTDSAVQALRRIPASPARALLETVALQLVERAR